MTFLALDSQKSLFTLQKITGLRKKWEQEQKKSALLTAILTMTRITLHCKSRKNT